MSAGHDSDACTTVYGMEKNTTLAPRTDVQNNYFLIAHGFGLGMLAATGQEARNSLLPEFADAYARQAHQEDAQSIGRCWFDFAKKHKIELPNTAVNRMYAEEKA